MSIGWGKLASPIDPHTPNRGITTEELDDLHAVLCLTERVAQQVSVCLLGGDT